MKLNLISLACYAGFGLAVVHLAPGEWTTAQYVAYFTILAVVLAIDMRSYRDGLKRGMEISNEVLHDLCKEKKIKVVPNVDR